MASRPILSAAQTLKIQMEAIYPGSKLTIVDKSKKSTIGRDYAIEHGLEIINDSGGVLVTAIVTRFDVLEMKACHNCGDEILTRAIGEIGNDECQDCADRRKAKFQVRLTNRVRAESERVARLEWMNNQAE